MPVVSDQPEGAVPTQAVYASLVPTTRSQRISRQFVVVCHDANLVGAGDVEKIIVLRPGEPPFEGSLFRPEISQGPWTFSKAARPHSESVRAAIASARWPAAQDSPRLILETGEWCEQF